MDKKLFKEHLKIIFTAEGYKKKGNNFTTETSELTKLINIQQSQFSDTFYLNYGFILKSIPLNNMYTHVEQRFGSDDPDETRDINMLLNLSIDIADDERIERLKQHLTKHLFPELQNTNTEKDVHQLLLSLPFLGGIPLVVKNYFGLKES